MNERTGGCGCGQVTYRVTGEPVASRVCWCRACQYISANGTVNAIFPTAALQVSGELTEYRRAADSGNEIVRRFCPRCGTHLFANSTGTPQLTALRMGALDDPSSVTPKVNIWAQAAPAWACLDPSLERVERQPAPLVAPPGPA